MRLSAVLLLPVLVCLPACLRRDGRNSECRWPGGAPGALNLDAEFAEELAVRYADAHHGLRSGHFESLEVYATERNRCMALMFDEVAKAHGVTAADVRGAIGRNRWAVDLAVNLPFALLFGFGVWVAIRRISARHSIEDGWGAWLAIVALCTLVLGVGGVLLGEQWAGLAESLRVGSGHLSYRSDRIPWVRHQTGMFAAVVILVWAIAGAQYWSWRSSRNEA